MYVIRILCVYIYICITYMYERIPNASRMRLWKAMPSLSTKTIPAKTIPANITYTIPTILKYLNYS